MSPHRVAVTLMIAGHLILAGGVAQADGGGPSPRLDTPSGLPVPRFVSLVGPTANCRIGPSLDHPVRFTYSRPGLPVLVVAETIDNWRKIRDSAGDECWAFHTLLAAQSHVEAIGETRLLAAPKGTAALRGRLSPGVLARLERRRGDWLLVAADGVRGWAPAAAFWGGADPN